MKNINPHPIDRQNNCRNASPVSIASQAGVDNRDPSWQAGLQSTWSGSLTGAAINENPDRCCDRGFSLSASALPYQSLRFASAMMMIKSNRRSIKNQHFQTPIHTYRCFTSKGPERIPIFGPFGLVQQLGAVEYARQRKFREKLHQWLKTIRLVWPECPAEITADGENLRINPAKSIHSAVSREPRSECLD
jgi:hypothetical protein